MARLRAWYREPYEPAHDGWCKSLCENFVQAVIPSEARNLALSVFKAVRDSSSPAAPRNDRLNKVLTQTLQAPSWATLSPKGNDDYLRSL